MVDAKRPCLTDDLPECTLEMSKMFKCKGVDWAGLELKNSPNIR